LLPGDILLAKFKYKLSVTGIEMKP